ncbi:MAG: glycosyltransferase involved in cell wall biosynthesis [Arenicella sp.]|jgi:glycosyltransferase involved in cell wall biosynthesis
MSSVTPKNYPKISLVMPSFNQGAYLESAINSVLSQNYPNLEMLIYDGGSSDQSVDIIRRYATQVSYWQSQEDGGQAAALSAGFERATGELFCWLNSDDILLPGALDKVSGFFMTHPTVEFVYSDRRLIDADGQDQGSHVWPRFLTSYHWALGQPMAQECCFWRSELYRRVGGVNPELYYIMDFDLFYRMWKVGRFKKISTYLGCIRFHDESKNSNAQDILAREMAEAKVKYGLKEPGYIMSRLLNRFDRLQSLLNRYSTWSYTNPDRTSD